MGDYTLQDAVNDLLEDIDKLWANNDTATWEMLKGVRNRIEELPSRVEAL